jgi:hypothetical protein
LGKTEEAKQRLLVVEKGVDAPVLAYDELRGRDERSFP